jgi:hypothetical protein
LNGGARKPEAQAHGKTRASEAVSQLPTLDLAVISVGKSVADGH